MQSCPKGQNSPKAVLVNPSLCGTQYRTSGGKSSLSRLTRIHIDACLGIRVVTRVVDGTSEKAVTMGARSAAAGQAR